MERKNSSEFEFLPLTLSMETLGGISTSIVKRGTPLPVTRSQVFSTASDRQKSVEIKILLGERPLAKHNLVIGSCLLENIPPAPKGRPQIRATFRIDKNCNVSVEAEEMNSKQSVKAEMDKTATQITNEVVQRLLREAEEYLDEDEARATIVKAEQRVRKDQERDLVTGITTRIEELIANIGLDLMSGAKANIATKTQELRRLLAEPEESYAFGGFDDLFGSFFAPKATRKATSTTRQSMKPQPENIKPQNIQQIGTYRTALVQSFLEKVDPNLEIKRGGAWDTLEANKPDSQAQAAYSMREVLRQMLDGLAPEEKVKQATWYTKPKEGSRVTRAMRVRYLVTQRQNENVESESTLALINGFAEAVESMYAKLSAETHSSQKAKVSTTRMYLDACEALIGLIAVACG